MLEFSWRIEPNWVIFTARQNDRQVPFALWPSLVDQSGAPTVAVLLESVESEEALAEMYELHLPWKTAANLSQAQRLFLQLPMPPDVALSVRNIGTLEQSAFSLEYRWIRTNGQPVVCPVLDGPFITIGKRQYLISGEFYHIVSAIDLFNSLPASHVDDRAVAWAEVQNTLPVPGQSSEHLNTTKYLKEVRIAYAGAFTVYPSNVNGDFDFEPVLFAKKPGSDSEVDDASSTLEEPTPLLSQVNQEYFANYRFKSSVYAKGRYVLKDGWILILSPELKLAMDVVRSAQAAGGETARAFVKNPRGYLKASLGDALDDEVIDLLFKETTEYSERVEGVGLWQKKVIPWVQVAREPWLPPTAIGLVIGGSAVPFKPEALPALIELIGSAIQRGEGEVLYDGTSVPATFECLTALETVLRSFSEIHMPFDDNHKNNGSDRRALIVKNNFDSVIFNSATVAIPPPVAPDLNTSILRTTPKLHQVDGIVWLQNCWQAGMTGALLADDMGLGKTFQALAFLSWISEAMRSGLIKREPILIVAPTGLLRNWENEIALHLNSPGLGFVERAYDASLKSLRVRSGSEAKLGEPLLDLRRLREAECILTTYETLRDYQFSFGQLNFGAIVYDEVQKVKTPGTLMTDAAKAMSSRFILALTGTPIENRLSDMWCIIDTIHPGSLGDLREFSEKYETDPRPEDLLALKTALTAPNVRRPPVMLRRMKEDVLEALPPKRCILIERLMPPAQSNAYASIVNSAMNRVGQHKMLAALQQMRQVSLAPAARDAFVSDDAYVNSSARLTAMMEILEDVRARQEKALIFVEYREAQAQLSGLLQRRFNLQRPPMIIAGDVSGAQRQERVEQFQLNEFDFDIMLLSPKAGGVGITLTAANNVIHLTRWWNPAVEDQSTDRCYRIGQRLPVNVYYPLAVLPSARAHSFDIRLHELLESKREMSRNLLLPVGGSQEDIRKLYGDTVF